MLYLKNLDVDASLKLFRRRTSYLQDSFGAPLPTSHPSTFQRALVRSSRVRLRTFNLLMGESHGLGVCDRGTIAPYSRLGFLRLRLFNLTSHHNVTRRFILQRHALTHWRRLELVVGTRFQVLYFTPLPGCFHLSLGTGSLSVIGSI